MTTKTKRSSEGSQKKSAAKIAADAILKPGAQFDDEGNYPVDKVTARASVPLRNRRTVDLDEAYKEHFEEVHSANKALRKKIIKELIDAKLD